MKKFTLAILFYLTNLYFPVFAQSPYQQFQYFDGADTGKYAIKVKLLPGTPTNIWQIGRPHKTIFNMAATKPNVIVTDTVKKYPSNNTSSFTFHVEKLTHSLLALRWKQKLNMDKHKDGGIIEFSLDNGVTWQNAFNSPIIYNFYGFDPSNKDTLSSGEYAFSGTDTTWRDVWFCISGFNSTPVDYRFTFKSDGINNQKEGWMIDNLIVHNTLLHILKENEKSDYLNVYPTATTGIVNIDAIKIQEDHVIETVQLYSLNGQLVREFIPDPSSFKIDISNLANGLYYLMVKTNLEREVFPIVLSR